MSWNVEVRHLNQENYNLYIQRYIKLIAFSFCLFQCLRFSACMQGVTETPWGALSLSAWREHAPQSQCSYTRAEATEVKYIHIN